MTEPVQIQLDGVCLKLRRPLSTKFTVGERLSAATATRVGVLRKGAEYFIFIGDVECSGADDSFDDC
jgi:hypothetical protein